MVSVAFIASVKTSRLICFSKIYKRCLLPTARDHFGRNATDWELQEDNDPKHMSCFAKQWRSDNSIQRIDWPSMSPDLSPIENVWKLLRMNSAKKKNLRTYKALVSAIKKEWKNFPKDLTINLLPSMENCISDVISNKGDFITY